MANCCTCPLLLHIHMHARFFHLLVILNNFYHFFLFYNSLFFFIIAFFILFPFFPFLPPFFLPGLSPFSLFLSACLSCSRCPQNGDLPAARVTRRGEICTTSEDSLNQNFWLTPVSHPGPRPWNEQWPCGLIKSALAFRRRSWGLRSAGNFTARARRVRLEGACVNAVPSADDEKKWTILPPWCAFKGQPERRVVF